MKVKATPFVLRDGTWACSHVVEGARVEGVCWDPISSGIGMKRVACGPCIDHFAETHRRENHSKYWGSSRWTLWQRFLWRAFRRASA